MWGYLVPKCLRLFIYLYCVHYAYTNAYKHMCNVYFSILFKMNEFLVHFYDPELMSFSY